ncbi:MAG: hypothetical protein JJU16_07885 [Alkalibacterium sp.]|nr:hypothetical protein [Alkalibacterium sp.]
MLLLVGLALIVYGYISFKYSDKKKTGHHRAGTDSQFPEWFPKLQKVGGLLFIIMGLLLCLTYFII